MFGVSKASQEGGAFTAAAETLLKQGETRYRVELAILGLLILAPFFVVGLLAGFKPTPLAAGVVVVVLLVGLLHLEGVVVEARRQGVEQE